MVRTSSLFSQLLQIFPRTKFSQMVSKHDAEKHAKGFTCRTQFVAMLFCHLARADSLREICNGLECCLGKLHHLGVERAPNKSTLSYANANRPAYLYRDLFYELPGNFRNAGMIGDGRHRALLLLKWMHYISSAGWSFSVLASMLRLNLFTYRDLHEWLDDPFRTPPKLPIPEQLPLNFKRPGQPASI